MDDAVIEAGGDVMWMVDQNATVRAEGDVISATGHHRLILREK